MDSRVQARLPMSINLREGTQGRICLVAAVPMLRVRPDARFWSAVHID